LQYPERMARRFYDALKDALEVTGWSLQKACEEADVSYDQFKKFMQRAAQDPNASTNVDAAVKLANAFGMTFDELISDETAILRSEAVALWRELRPEEREFLRSAAEARHASQDHLQK
jgi:transcriptional regulator with XRE-family HTH domain